MEAKMGNVSRTLQPQQDWTQSKPSRLGSKAEEKAPTTGERSKIAELVDDSDPLSAARGAVLGVALGSIVWAVILWALL
jgi:hypothetical protein